MSATIETAFAEIVQAHDCTYVQISYSPAMPEGYIWTLALHWEGFTRSGISCKHGFGVTPAVAFENALASMKADREPLARLDEDTTVDFEVAS
jgi:hypothetical protein